MSLTINTNLSAIQTQRALSASTNRLNKAIERMTTGYKINSTKDDAAGYAIAKDMEVKKSSYEVALNNTMMATSLLSTATNSMDILTDHLQRIRDLCEQAANGTYGEDSRLAIQTEIDQRIDEISRIIDITEFNEIKLFKSNGTTPSPTPTSTNKYITKIIEETPNVIITDPTQLASAIADNEKIGIANAETLAQLATLVNNGTTCEGKTIILTEDIDLSDYSSGKGWTPIGNSWTNSLKGTFNGNGHKVTNLKINSNNTGQGLFGLFSGVVKNIGVENVDINGGKCLGGIIGASASGSTIDNCYATGKITLTTGSESVGGIVGWGDSIKNSWADVDITASSSKYVGGIAGGLRQQVENSYSLGDIVGSNNVGGVVGYNGSSLQIYNSYSTGNIKGNSSTGGVSGSSYIPLVNSFSTGTVTGSGGLTNHITEEELQQKIASGLLPIAKYDPPAPPPEPTTNKITFQVGITSSDESQISVDTTLDLGEISIDVSTSDSARTGLDTVDKVLDQIMKKQTELGSVQNRLDSVMDAINVSIDNLTSSISTVKDADIAEVSSEYINAQILQQASVTLLATANQTPSIALQLI